jgi:hypothetical protein
MKVIDSQVEAKLIDYQKMGECNSKICFDQYRSDLE